MDVTFFFRGKSTIIIITTSFPLRDSAVVDSCGRSALKIPYPYIILLFMPHHKSSLQPLYTVSLLSLILKEVSLSSILCQGIPPHLLCNSAVHSMKLPFPINLIILLFSYTYNHSKEVITRDKKKE